MNNALLDIHVLDLIVIKTVLKVGEMMGCFVGMLNMEEVLAILGNMAMVIVKME